MSSRRRMPDLLALLCGIAALGIATTAIAGSSAWLPPVDARWLLAGGAMVIGLLLLVSSLRPGKR
ncbi:MAG: hypothetical protein GEU83_06765 [Pseudonocardiaceae bacterium]|nr:hypothetical protein [Pseudonocardiaceae bacterium]